MHSVQPASELQTYNCFSDNPGSQSSSSGSIKKVNTKKELPIDRDPNTVPLVKNRFVDQRISSEEKTVMEFSLFCRDFYSKDKEYTPPPLPEGADFTLNSDPISDFCKMMRVISNDNNYTSRVNDIIKTIKINSYHGKDARKTLTDLIHKKEYQHITGVDVARRMLPQTKKSASGEADTSIKNTACRRSIRTLASTQQQTTKTHHPYSTQKQDEISSASHSAIQRTPIKQRKAIPRTNHDTLKIQKKECKLKQRAEEKHKIICQIVKLCLEEAMNYVKLTTKIQSIKKESTRWKEITVFSTTLKRWIYALKNEKELDYSFTTEQIKKAKHVFFKITGEPTKRITTP